MIVADAGGPLRFLPLPELASLHTNSKSFSATARSGGSNTTVLVDSTTNSFHTNFTVDVSALSGHARAPIPASISLGVFADAGSPPSKPGISFTLLAPWSVSGQKALADTSILGEALKVDAGAATAEACAAACVADNGCGGWTLREPRSAVPDVSGATCTLMKAGARVLANVGSGCDALGHGNGTDKCTSGIVGWQLAVPGLSAHIGVLLPPTHTVTLELFADQQICEVFLHDGRGHGSAVATVGCAPKTAAANAVTLVAEGVDGVKVSGALSDMADSIFPPPAEHSDVGRQASPNICASNATIGQAVIDAVNLSWPGLEAVKASAAGGDLGAACEGLATYYREGHSSSLLRLRKTPAPSTRRAGGNADDLLFHDRFHLGGVGQVAAIPRNADGGINWLYKGPKDDPEFMNCLNRHDSFTDLAQAWNDTGNEEYAQAFSRLLMDWVGHLPCNRACNASGTQPNPQICPDTIACTPLGMHAFSTNHDFKHHRNCSWAIESGGSCVTGRAESPWRVLEVGIRMAGPWPSTFFGLQQARNFTTSARVMMLLGFSEHHEILNGAGHFASTTPNWVITQMEGLIASCVALPELNNCSRYIDAAFVELEAWLDREVYPDGIEAEEAFGYGMGTANSFFKTISLLKTAGHAPPPASYLRKVERMFSYGVFANDQWGFSPRDGDADLERGGWLESATEYFDRDDWRYVHSGGEQGTKPAGEPSKMFPYGGQAVLRNKYENDTDAVWMLKMVGPFGSSGHAHASKLSITLRAFGSMLLVDSGRFQYNGVGLSHTLFRQYERTTTAHNTLTFDGKQQAMAPALASGPVPNSSWSFGEKRDFVAGSMSMYEGLSGHATHHRSTLYVKQSANNLPSYIVVVDCVTTDRNRTVSASWHAHPNSNVSLRGKSATITGVETETAKPSAAVLTLVPSSGGAFAWSSAAVVRGQVGNETAPWQGWYSSSYNGNDTAPTLVYDAQIPSAGAVFGWLLIPQNQAPQGEAVAATLSLARGSTGCGGRVEATVSIGGQKELVAVAPE